MKINSIILACLFVLTLFSCTMDDVDALDRMDNELSNTDKDNSALAALTCNVFVNALSTKAAPVGEEKTEEIASTETINHCSIILINKDGKVLDARDNVKVENGALQTKFALKDQTGIKVVVIANSSQAFVACNSLDDINDIIQKGADLASLVKMGVKEDVSTTGSTYDNPTNVNIELHQLAARIELASFNITDKSFKQTLPVDVTLKNITLLNVNNGCKTILTGNEDNTIGKTTAVFAKHDILVYNASEKKNMAFTDENKPVFYSFPKSAVNENKDYKEGDNAVTVKIDFTVGDIAYTKYYKVKHDNNFLVKSGYLYRLNVNMTAESNEVEFNVTCSVNDWLNNRVDIPMQDAN